MVTEKRINRGAGYGLEIPVEYVFNGNEKALQWAKKNLDNVDANVNKKVGLKLMIWLKRWLKLKYEWLCYLKRMCDGFCFVFLACSLLGGNFHQEYPIGTVWLCPLMGGVRY